MRLLHHTAASWLSGAAVAAPPAHAELLNQLRASEDFARRFPRLACAPLLRDGPLKAKYRKHLADAERHDRLFAAAIRRLGEQPHAVSPERDYALALWREAMAAGVAFPYARLSALLPLDRSERMSLWAILAVAAERRVEELSVHRTACEAAGQAAMVELVDGILRDERDHAEYALRALDNAGSEMSGTADESMGVDEAPSLLGVMRGVELRAHRRVTGAFVRAMLAGPLAEASFATRAALHAWAATLPSDGPASEGAW